MVGPYHPSLMEGVWLPVAVAVVGIGLATILFVAAIVLRLRDHPVPSAVPGLIAASFGAGASLTVIAWADAALPQLALLVAVVAVPAIFAVAVRRLDLAGWYLAAAGLPALLWWGSLLAEDGAVLVWAAAALAVVLIGVALILAGRRQPTAQRPVTDPDQPDPTRVVALAMAMRDEISLGPFDLPNSVSFLAGLFAGVVAWMALTAAGVPPLPTAVVSALVLALVSTELFYHLWPRRLERAMATHAFLGSWEVKRFRGTAGPSVPTSAAAAREWLRANPETDENRWVRPELLAWTGDIQAAYEVLERFPTTTDVERFERASTTAHLDTVAGTGADVDGLAAMADEVGAPGSEERLRAIAAVALARSREILRLGDGDWKRPLIEAQERIGPRSLGIVRADTWWPRLRMNLVVAAAFAFIAVSPLLL